MSRFLSEKHKNTEPYNTSGEHSDLNKYIKLNTNESPFPPSPKAIKYAAAASNGLNLYSDPDCTELGLKLVKLLNLKFNLNLKPENIIFGNGSDEILNFAFAAFCDNEHGAAFPDITYTFYKVLAEAHGVPFERVKLKDFKIIPDDYFNIKKNIFIANPNAPTGLALSLSDIEGILKSNQDNVVLIDEAYVDFGAESCVKLINKYENLLVAQTFSKSRSLAGGRLGFAVGNENLISDLKIIKNSFSPYNINSMTMAAAMGALEDDEYFNENCRKIIDNREFLSCELKNLGFEFNDSRANFVFARHNEISGLELFNKLKERNILVRHFNDIKLNDYNRITIGALDQMKILINAVREILF